MKWAALALVVAFAVLDAYLVFVGIGFGALCVENSQNATTLRCAYISLALLALPSPICVVAGIILWLRRHYASAIAVSAIPLGVAIGWWIMLWNEWL